MEQFSGSKAPSYISEQAYDKKVGHFVSHLLSSLRVPEEELCEALQLRVHDLPLVIQGTQPLGISQFARLAFHFRFSLDAFDRDQVDLQAVREHYFGNLEFLPEKYEKGAGSQIRAVRNVMQYISSNYGRSLSDSVFDYFNFTERAFANPERPISVYFLEDILTYLRGRGVNRHDVLAIGIGAVEQARGSVFSKEMAGLKTPRLMYERYLTELIGLVESNNQYSLLKSTRDECLLESKENPKLQEFFKTPHIGGPNRCLYRVGALSAATRFIGLPDAFVEEINCVHRGDPSCLFRINYQKSNFARTLMKKRRIVS